jgi:hypothetical protein
MLCLCIQDKTNPDTFTWKQRHTCRCKRSWSSPKNCVLLSHCEWNQCSMIRQQLCHGLNGLSSSGLSLRRTKFEPESVHMGFVVDKLALTKVFLRVFMFYPFKIIHRGCILLYHLGDEQQARWWPQFRDIWRHRHQQQQHDVYEVCCRIISANRVEITFKKFL